MADILRESLNSSLVFLSAMWANAGTNGALPGRGGELSVEGLLLWMVVLKQRQAVWEMLIFVGLEQRQEPDGFESWTILDPSGAPTTTLSSLSEHSKTHGKLAHGSPVVVAC